MLKAGYSRSTQKGTAPGLFRGLVLCRPRTPASLSTDTFSLSALSEQLTLVHLGPAPYTAVGMALQVNVYDLETYRYRCQRGVPGPSKAYSNHMLWSVLASSARRASFSDDYPPPGLAPASKVGALSGW